MVDNKCSACSEARTQFYRPEFNSGLEGCDPENAKVVPITMVPREVGTQAVESAIQVLILLPILCSQAIQPILECEEAHVKQTSFMSVHVQFSNLHSKLRQPDSDPLIS